MKKYRELEERIRAYANEQTPDLFDQLSKWEEKQDTAVVVPLPVRRGILVQKIVGFAACFAVLCGGLLVTLHLPKGADLAVRDQAMDVSAGMDAKDEAAPMENAEKMPESGEQEHLPEKTSPLQSAPVAFTQPESAESGVQADSAETLSSPGALAAPAAFSGKAGSSDSDAGRQGRADGAGDLLAQKKSAQTDVEPQESLSGEKTRNSSGESDKPKEKSTDFSGDGYLEEKISQPEGQYLVSQTDMEREKGSSPMRKAGTPVLQMEQAQEAVPDQTEEAANTDQGGEKIISISPRASSQTDSLEAAAASKEESVPDSSLEKMEPVSRSLESLEEMAPEEDEGGGEPSCAPQYAPASFAYYSSVSMPLSQGTSSTEEQVVAETMMMQGIVETDTPQDTADAIPLDAVPAAQEQVPITVPFPVETGQDDLEAALDTAFYETEIQNLIPSWLPEDYSLTDVNVVFGDEPEDKKTAVVSFSGETGSLVITANHMKHSELVPAIAPERLVELENGLKLDLEHSYVLEGNTVVSNTLKAYFAQKGVFYRVEGEGTGEKDFLCAIQSIFE